jgi:flagellar hook-length control protein FliK
VLAGATPGASGAATTVLAAGMAKSSKSAVGTNQKGAGKRSTLSANVDSSTAALSAATPMIASAAPALDDLSDIDSAGTEFSGLDAPAVAMPYMADSSHETDGSVGNPADAASSTTSASSRAVALAAPSLLTMPSGSDQGNDPRAAGNTAVLDPGATDSSSAASLAALSNLVRALPASEASSRSVERSIDLPLSDPNWPHALAAQVQMLTAGNIQSATLRLSPEHLGPVEVHIEVQSAQVNVSFSAAHAETRSALEQSVPVLRALFAHGGLTLGQSSVQGETRPGSQSFKTRAQGLVAAGSEPTPPAACTLRAMGLVDEYA